MILPRLVLTPGEPAGIGPDITLQLLQQKLPCEMVVVADKALLAQRAQQLEIKTDFVNYQKNNFNSNAINVIHVPMITPVIPGVPNSQNAVYVLETLRVATAGCLNHEFTGLVTAPVHKAIINEAGIAFSGHTEYLAQLTHTKMVVMMLVAKQLRVALVTTHLPVADVAKAITTEKIIKTVNIIHHDLKTRFNMANPRIAVCGLNPHAGENGYLGREEIDIIAPALKILTSQGIAVKGPLSADTIFTADSLKTADVIVVMYHDQGLPVLKYAGFGHAVNVTLGLPIIRTSVDHGTAFDLAGTGKADWHSLEAAVELAAELATNGT